MQESVLFGWNPTRSGAKDKGDWDWGGNLVVHELFQEKDGQLASRSKQCSWRPYKSRAIVV